MTTTPPPDAGQAAVPSSPWKPFGPVQYIGDPAKWGDRERAAYVMADLQQNGFAGSDDDPWVIDFLVRLLWAEIVPLAPPREVTEAMVEEALDAYIPWSGWREWADEDVKKCRANMRRALTAALNAPARVDENALPMDMLPDGWDFACLETFDNEGNFDCELSQGFGHTFKTIGAIGPTPRAAMIAAIEAARERGDE